MERVFNLPDLGEGLEDAEIVEWKVAEGDAVELNQPLVDVNTAKALVEIPSPFAGTVVTLHGAAGDVVEVGTPLITIEVSEGAVAEATTAGSGEKTTPETPPKREAVLVGYGVDQEAKAHRRRLRAPGNGAAAPVVAPRPEPHPEPLPEAPRGRRAKASPVVRRLARERGVDLAAVEGSGPGGRVRRDDVLRAVGDPAAGSESPLAPIAFGTEERVPVRGARRLIAKKMAKAWAEVPHVTTFRTIDATWVEALRRELTEESGVKVSPLPVVVRALVEVCMRHPKLNATFDADAREIVLKRWFNVGIATDTDQGLLVPVVHDAHEKGIVTIAREIADLVAATREGRATPEQLGGSTITVTNVGTFGSEYGTPIINIPEVAILALGVIEPRPAVIEGRIEARAQTTLSLSFDHRIIDGAEAGRALTDLQAILESPFRLGALPRH
ncbi:MAG TPA: dihydrolipoamide acetyltransferase family protein [Actinomycetota bacterium]